MFSKEKIVIKVGEKIVLSCYIMNNKLVITSIMIGLVISW